MIERFEAPSTRTFLRISFHCSMSVCTLLPRSGLRAGSQGASLKSRPGRIRDAQVLPFWILATDLTGAAVFDPRLHLASLGEAFEAGPASSGMVGRVHFRPVFSDHDRVHFRPGFTPSPSFYGKVRQRQINYHLCQLFGINFNVG